MTTTALGMIDSTPIFVRKTCGHPEANWPRAGRDLCFDCAAAFDRTPIERMQQGWERKRAHKQWLIDTNQWIYR